MKISTILLIILLVGCQEEAPIQSEFSIRRDVGVLRLEDAASSEGDVPIQVDVQGKLMATCSNKKCLNMLCEFDEKMKLNCECKKEIKKTEENTYDDRLRYLDLGSGNAR